MALGRLRLLAHLRQTGAKKLPAGLVIASKRLDLAKLQRKVAIKLTPSALGRRVLVLEELLGTSRKETLLVTLTATRGGKHLRATARIRVL